MHFAFNARNRLHSRHHKVEADYMHSTAMPKDGIDWKLKKMKTKLLAA